MAEESTPPEGSSFPPPPRLGVPTVLVGLKLLRFAACSNLSNLIAISGTYSTRNFSNTALYVCTLVGLPIER